MNVPNEICQFEAGWDYIGQIWIAKEICNACNQEKACVCIDSSEGEYGEGTICFECIDKAKKKLIDGTTKV